MSEQTISIAFCGSGGAGVMTAGQALLNAVAKAGYYGIMARSLGPQIRGGEAAAMLRFSSERIENQGNCFEVLLAFDWENITRFRGELPLKPDSVVICDEESGNPPEFITESKPKIINVPLKEIAESIKGGRVNMVGLGLVAGLIGLDNSFVIEVLEKSLRKKGQEAVDSALACLDKGKELAVGIPKNFGFTIKPIKVSKRWSITGNEAAGLGAVKGGVRFVAAYPITPATDILEWMAPNLKKIGGTLVQAEDELASIAMILGASFGGIPSLTATSGPGLALMQEGIGLGIASEIPLVIVNVQRGGPSTGIPTKSEQCDLNIAVYGTHGDSPHLVLSPNSPSDCLFTTQWATELAERLQCPAIVLSDQFMGQARVIVDEPTSSPSPNLRVLAKQSADGYKRYAITPSGVSPMAIPGIEGCEYIADGLEHDETGLPSTQNKVHSDQLDKRMRKLTAFDYGEKWADVEGNGETAIIVFGSITGSVREALKQSGREKDFRLISLRLIYPVMPEAMNKLLKGVKKTIIIEQNHLAQFYHFLKAHYELPAIYKNFARPGPLPIKPEEIIEIIKDRS